MGKDRRPCKYKWLERNNSNNMTDQHFKIQYSVICDEYKNMPAIKSLSRRKETVMHK